MRERALAVGAVLGVRGPLRPERGGLSGHSAFEEFLGQDRAGREGHVFQVRQGRAPRRTVVAPEFVGQVLGDPFEVAAVRFECRRRRGRACHRGIP